MRTLPALALLAAVAAAPFASAQAPAAGLLRIAGVVSAIRPDGLTIKSDDGKKTALGLAPGWSLVENHPVPQDAVKPGAFVASANLSQAEGVGRSLELRMFEPGSRLGEGNRPMTQPGAQAGQMMTNATVTKASVTAAGLELDVAYPGGTRHLVVPPEVPVIASTPLDPASLKVGTKVLAIALPGDGGAMRAVRVQLEK